MNFIFTKLTSTLLVIALIAFGYFLFTAIGDTTINVTLKTNPTLEDGLVGHWTFDGKDTSGGGERWYDSSYGFKRALTITAGGGSGGAATTTTNGYAVLATTTLSTLKVTGSGGNVEFSDGRDIIFTDDDDTTLLDFHIESYDSTTGELVAWIEVESISSTTAQTFHIYYGNASATDQSDEAGTYNDTYAGVWHLPEDPSSSAPQMLDSTSNNNDGTSAGNMLTEDQVTGQIDGSLDFDGGDDSVDVGNDIGTGSGGISLSAWIKSDAVFSNETIIDLWYSGALSYKFRLDDGVPEGFIYTSASQGGTFSSSVSAGEFAHLVLTYDGATIRLYNNGVVDSTTFSQTGNVNTNVNSTMIGLSGTDDEPFDGLIDEVRVYSTALHAMDILTNYNYGVDNTTFLSWGSETAFSGGTATDVSGNGNDGTIQGANKVLGKIGQAYDFDGTDDYVDIGAGPASVNSVAFWVYPETTTEYFVNLTSTTDYIWVSGGTVTATGFTSPTIYVDGVVSSTLVADQWQHVVVTTATSENASNLDIGRTADTNYMEGKIDDVRFYSDVLSAGEVKRLYELGGTTHVNVTLKTNPTLESGLVGHWTFDGKDVNKETNVITDSSGQGNHGSTSGMDTATTTAIGVIGQAFEFDGTDDYVDIIDSNSLDVTNITLSAWIKTNTSGRYIIAKDPPSDLISTDILSTSPKFAYSTVTDFIGSWFDNAIATVFADEINYGNLIIKVGNGSGYEDGDIIHAFNSSQILNVHTQHIVHPKNMARDSRGAIQANSLLETYLENTREFKFERISQTEITKTNLWLGGSYTISNIPNADREYMDVALYIKRRLTLKPNQNKMFGEVGSEYWYGGNTKVTNAKLDIVWNDIETKTTYRKEDYREFPFTDKELSSFYVIKTDDFTDTEAGEYTAPEYDTDGETILKSRKYKVDWTSLNLTAQEAISKNNKNGKSDNRSSKSYNRANVIKLK